MSAPRQLAIWLSALLWLAAGAAAAEAAKPDPCPSEVVAKPSAPLDLNSATEAQLLGLPGIGPSRAKAILAYRDTRGGFVSLSQLLQIKGFGRATLKRLRPLLTLSPPALAASQAEVHRVR